MKKTVLVLSCEHGVNSVPPEFAKHFIDHQAALNANDAVDFGARDVAHFLQVAFQCDYWEASATRLLIDCNRSLHHAHCFSEITNQLPAEERKKIIDSLYLPFRQGLAQQIQDHIHAGEQVLHVSVHSFSPLRDKQSRNAAVGLLYDASRHGEKEVARLWSVLLKRQNPHYRVRSNYPFSGGSDSVTTCLRKDYPQTDYLGFELECNQALLKDSASSNQLMHALMHSLRELLQML